MKIKKGLAFKTSLGYFMIALVSIIVFVSSVVILNKNRKIDAEISESIIPVMVLYKDMNMLLLDMRRLGNSWIYTPNADDKKRLANILQVEHPAWKKRIKELLDKNTSGGYREDLMEIEKNFDAIAQYTRALTRKLARDEDYGSDELVDQSLTIYDNQIVPVANKTSELLTGAIQACNNLLLRGQQDKDSAYTMLFGSFLGALLFTVVAGIVSVAISHRIIIKPINELKDVMNALGQGEIIDVNDDRHAEDEISEMRKSIGYTLSGLRESAEFAVQIGTGNYDRQFTPLSEKDQMGNALIEMRNNLKQSSEEENRRIWATAGIAKISEILRKSDLKLPELCDEVIKFVVKYTDANQGGLFISDVNEHDKTETLVLQACYAYERKKFLTKTIEPGDGLVGQCYLEGQMIYMNQIPDKYFNITSGLGGATPNELAVLPLKLNAGIYGVLELATFNKFEKHKIEFLEKVCESIASAISTAKTSEQTMRLLEATQTQAAILREQEEEMRQNMEELQATQEEMSRKEQDYVQRIRELESYQSSLLNADPEKIRLS